MSYGLQVNNINNIIQIDSDYANYGVYAKGTISIGANTGITSTITKPASLTKLFFELKSGIEVTIKQPAVYNENWVLEIANDGVATTLEYLIIAPSYSNLLKTDLGQWGLEIYKADGNLAYSTRFQYPTLKHFLTFPVTLNLADAEKQYNGIIASSPKKLYIDLLELYMAGSYTLYDEFGIVDQGDVLLRASMGATTLWVRQEGYFIFVNPPGGAEVMGVFVTSTRYFGIYEL